MKNPETILLVCKSLPWRFNGGIQTHAWELAKALVAQGKTVTILTGGAFLSPETSSMKDGVEILEMPFFPGRYIKPIAYLSEELAFNLKVKKWVKKHHAKYDIIHAQGRSGSLLAFNKEINKKLVTTFHGLISREISNNKWYDFNGKTHAIFAKIFERIVLRKSILSIAVSNSLINDINTLHTQKNSISFIPNGVKINHVLSPSIKPLTDKFLFVGRLHPVKGLDKLLREFSHALPQVSLDIIGDGPSYNSLRHLVDQLGIEDRVNFLGAMDNDSILEAIPYYRALILPSSYETQGIVLLEANAKGIPVIASDISAIRESIIHEHNGLLCDPNDSGAFIRAINLITTNPEYANKMGTKGYLHMQSNFGWDKIASKTIGAYQQIAS